MNHFLIFGNLGAGEVIIIALMVLLLFGGKKIPELMKGIGKGVRSFKDGVSGIKDEIDSDSKETGSDKSKSDDKSDNK